MAMFYNLLHFKKVIEAGSINKASRLLNICQPALSKSIKTLEQHYDVKLLERHPRGIRPTAYGNILYQTACEMEKFFLNSEKKIMEEKLLHDPQQQGKEINIGCSTIWNDFLLPEVMRNIEKTDSFAINITNDTSEQLLENLAEHDSYDFVLCRIVEKKVYKDLKYIPLFQSQPAVFIDDHHPIFSRGFDINQLQKLNWIKLKSLPVLQPKDLTPAGLAFFPENFFPPAVSFEVEDLMAAIQLLRNNYIINLPLGLAGLLKKYNIRPLPFPKTLTNEYWLGMVQKSSDELPLYIRNLMNKIQLYFSTNVTVSG